jgi:pyruvate dehydrogenase E1 component alpha subunit
LARGVPSLLAIANAAGGRIDKERIMASSVSRTRLDRATALEWYRQMYLIRRFEERAAEMYANAKIGGYLHLYIGQEAVAVGAVGALRPDDHLTSHYRDHGHALAKGASARACMAELFGKVTGTTEGRGGSMHLVAPEHHYWGGHAIVGGHIPFSVGLAFASAYNNEDRVTLCIFGDGAVGNGEFHESLNAAALYKLPIVFLIENNFYAMGTALHRGVAQTQLYKKGCAYDIPGEPIDGMNVLAVHDAVSRAVERARAGEGPTLLEAMTYRFRGHSMQDPQFYRTKEEVEENRKRDPIVTFQRKLVEEGLTSDDEIKRLEEDINAEVDDAVRFADESPVPELSSLFDHLYEKPERH